MNNKTRYVDHITSFSGQVQLTYNEKKYKYEVNDQGIVEIIEFYKDDGTLKNSVKVPVMSKEVFILAYKTYIEGEKS